MKKMMIGFTCLYGLILLLIGFQSTAQMSPASPVPPRKKEVPASAQIKAPPKGKVVQDDPNKGSFNISNKTGVYTTATPRSISIQGITVNPVFKKQYGTDAVNEIVNALKYQEISSDTENPTTVSRGIIGLQLKIGNKIYLASLHNIPENAVLEVVDKGMGYVMQSPSDATIKIRPINLQFSKGQTQILKTGIDIPDLPPQIFDIKKMGIPGLNPLSE
jgi:hypothetical protein